MRAVYLMLLLLLIASCANNAEIKNSGNKNFSDARIRTTRVDMPNETAEQRIIFNLVYPHNGEVINGSNVAVKLEAVNFRIVPVGSPVRSREGHFHVWLDSEKRVTTNSTTIFENVVSGKHTIVAELVRSDHNSLEPKLIKTITINVENGFVQKQEAKQPGIDEFTVEVDDRGFYPSTIQAKIGSKIKINFKFRDDSIYFAGLDVKGPFPTIQYKLHGKQPVTAEFTMSEAVRIESYWPSTGVHKATLNVGIVK